MITLTKANINALKFLGFGTFAHVYRDGDFAYKIYKPQVNAEHGQVNNPCLAKFNPERRRLIKKAKQVKYTDLIDEEITVDDKFGGVKYKYQDGKPLSHLYINLSYFQKRDLSLKLIRNTEELIAHHIYPQDYKMNNIICDENNEPHIIDLDDVLTKVTIFPNRHYQNEARFGLKQTIMAMFNDASLNLLPVKTREQLDSYQTYNALFNKRKTTSSDISDYLISKEEAREYLFIDIDEATSLMDTIKGLIDEKGVKVVLTINKFEYDKTDYYFAVTQELKSHGISIYDILTLGFDYTIDSYTEASNTIGYYTHDKILTYTRKQ
mgnify:CR=1 FL=1